MGSWVAMSWLLLYIDGYVIHPDSQTWVLIVIVQLYEIASGLAYLHGEGIVHGDLHGGNILIDAGGHACLTDFGLAVIAEGSSYNYGSLHGGGAIKWTAPELLAPDEFGLEDSRPTFQSDVYAFGCMCVEVGGGVVLS